MIQVLTPVQTSFPVTFWFDFGLIWEPLGRILSLNVPVELSWVPSWPQDATSPPKWSQNGIKYPKSPRTPGKGTPGVKETQF